MKRLLPLGVLLGVVVLCAEVAPLPAQPPPSATAPKPPWQRLLQGEDAKRAQALQKRIADLVKQDELAEALRCGQELATLRGQVQGEDHWEAADARQQVQTLQHLSGKTPPERTRYRQARTLAAEAAAQEAKGQHRTVQSRREEVLAIHRKLFGEEHPATAASYNNLASNLYAQGKYAEAEEGLRKALALRRQLLGEAHPETARSYNRLAMNQEAQGQYAAAEEGYRQALALRRQLLGEADLQTATSYNYLARNLNAQGKHAAAEEGFRKALALRRQLLGEAHLQTANSYNNLAGNLEAQRKYADAEESWRKALALRLQLLGEAHPLTAQSYHNLAGNLEAQDKYAEAEEGLRKELALRCQLLGEAHPDIAICYNHLAMNLDAQGKYAEAEESYRKALALRRQLLGEAHPHTAQSYNNLAVNLNAQGKYAEAEESVRKALALRRQLLGEAHFSTASSYNNLADSLHAQGKYAEAEEGYRKALALHRKLLGEAHRRTAGSYNNLALNLDAQDKHAEAEQGHRKALELLRQLLGEAHRDTATSYNNLALNLQAQGKYAEAEEGFRKALELSRQLLGEAHPHTATSYYNLALNQGAQGQYAAAEEGFRKALELNRQLLGEAHPHTAQSYNSLAHNLNAQGKYADAEEAYTRAADSFLHARVALTRSGLERAAKTGEMSPLLPLAAVLARNGKPVLAWQRLEQGLGRSTWDELSARLPRSASEQARLNQLQARLRRLDSLLERAAASKAPGPEQEQERKRLLEEQRTALEELAAFHQQSQQQYGVREGAVYSLEKIQALLPADTAFLTWVDIPGQPRAQDPNGEHWAVVVRQRGTPAWVRLPGTGAQHAWTPDDAALPDTLRKRVGSAAAPADWSEFVRRLQAQRIAPIRAHLEAGAGLPAVRHVIVLHSRKMDAVPEEVLLEGVTVSYAPSATLALHLRQQSRSPHQGLLALGDPVFAGPRSPDKSRPLPSHGLLLTAVPPGSNAAQAGLRPNDVLLGYNGTPLEKRDDLKGVSEGPDAPKAVPVEVWREGKTFTRNLRPGQLGAVLAEDSAPVALEKQRRSDRLLASARGGEWQALPGTRAEVEALQRLFAARKEPVRLLTASDASEQKLRELADRGELSNYRYLHLATHGEFDGQRPLQSAIILARDALPDPGQQLLANKPLFDGMLTAGKVLEQWRLDADLVTLSACQSALGKFEKGEGFMGFAQALLLTGARSVCLSLWKVDDTATALLMERFYQNLLGQRDGLAGPLRKAEALAEAKQWLRTLPRDEARKRAAVLTQGVARGKNQPLRPLLSEVPATVAGQKPTPPYAHPYYWAAFVLIGDPE